MDMVLKIGIGWTFKLPGSHKTFTHKQFTNGTVFMFMFIYNVLNCTDN